MENSGSMFFDQAYDRSDGEAMMKHQRGPHRDAAHDCGAHSVAVEKWQHGEHFFFAKCPTSPLILLPRVRNHVGVTQCHCFGRTCRSTSGQDVGWIMNGIDRDRLPFSLRCIYLMPKPFAVGVCRQCP